MTNHRLHHTSKGVVHKSPKRTRLRVPKKYRQRQTLQPVEEAISRVPGVEQVQVNPATGSILVQHDARDGMLAAIGAAIEQTAPDLLAALMEPETLIATAPDLLTKIFRGYALEPRNGDGTGGSTSLSEDEIASRSRAVKRWVPMAFLTVGFFKLMRDETLLGSIPPLALFYYAFDSYWKFKQETAVQTIKAEDEANLPKTGHNH